MESRWKERGGWYELEDTRMRKSKYKEPKGGKLTFVSTTLESKK